MDETGASKKSILDDLGQEAAGIAAPVSLCMLVTVLLVRTLPPKEGNVQIIEIASAFYHEKGSDDDSTKLIGSVINAVIFIVVVTLMTFGLYLLFKYRCTLILKGYFAFALFSIFFSLVGIITLQLLQKFQINFDIISYLFILYNFAVVGVTSVFFWPAPLTLKQSYLVVTAVVTAYLFTHIPEWTTWTLLIAMALYDLYAVLSPAGPLKAIVELAIERGEDLPALVYEGRPMRRGATGSRQSLNPRSEEVALVSSESSTPASSSSASHSLEHNLEHPPPGPSLTIEGEASENEGEAPRLPPSISEPSGGQPGPAEARSGTESEARATPRARHGAAQEMTREGAGEALRGTPESQERLGGGSRPGGVPQGEPDSGSEDQYLPDGIKLGLGDFIFYSVLVAQAAKYDLLTVFACYLAVMAGLGLTLLLLMGYQKALPALPISIALGIAFYFTSRVILEPFVLPLSTSLLFF
eukprot:jgi/Botrbrau1/23150/Bobra.0041s0002.1